MFSHIVTAAKGLFAGQNSDPDLPPSDSSELPASKPNKSKMVTATRRRSFPPADEQEPAVNGAQDTNSKRKSGATKSDKPETQRSKRRKRTSLEAAQDNETGTSNEKSEVAEEPSAQPEQKQPTKHFRFGSEEPELPLDTTAEEPAANEQEQDSSDDDDEAPEQVDNSAQVHRAKTEAKKLERARQIEEQLKREKRKQLDALRKQQAKSSTKKRERPDDMLSESTETLQGSNTQDARRSALPALLPDDILNAEPVARPPTPPAEGMGIVHRKPNKLRFLEKSEKAPKDVDMGDVTIRVLDGDSSRKKAKTTILPPKTAKPARNAKQNWLNRGRSTGQVNGLRRTTGGTGGFVRK